jgi:hypothetical protein
MKTKKCNHETSRLDYGQVDGEAIEIARWCVACGALLKLAAANDNHAAVPVEIAAALLAENVAGQPRGPVFDPEARGWDDRCEDVVDDHEHTPGESIGWLAHAIVNHDDEQAELASAVPRDARPEGAS